MKTRDIYSDLSCLKKGGKKSVEISKELKLFVNILISLGLRLCWWVWQTESRMSTAVSWSKNKNTPPQPTFEPLLLSYEMERTQVPFRLWELCQEGTVGIDMGGGNEKCSRQ